MPRNVWSAGIREFDESVARREADRRLEEDRVRRARLDEESKADRERAFGQRDRELASIDQYRDDQIGVRNAAATRETQEREAAQKHAEALGSLLDQYTEAVVAGSEDMKRALGLKILNMGGKLPPAEPKEPNAPAPREVGGRVYHFVDGKWKDMGAATKTPAFKDTPEMPNEFKKELDWFAMNGRPFNEAAAAISQKWNSGEYRMRYPQATAGAALKYLESTYNVDPLTREMTPPVPNTWKPGGGGAAPPPAAGPAPQVPPVVPPPREDLSFGAMSAGPTPITLGTIAGEQPDTAALTRARDEMAAQGSQARFASAVAAPVGRAGTRPIQPGGPPAADAALREQARAVLAANGLDQSEAAIDVFLSKPANVALLKR